MSTKQTSKKTTAKKVAKAPVKAEIKKEPSTTPETPDVTPETQETPSTTPETQETPNTTPETTGEPIKEKKNVIGSLKGGKEVHQSGHLRVQAVRTVIPARELPEDIRRWLMNKGYGTNIYLKPKEWLEKHHVDLKMVEKLKKFINDRYL